MAEKIICVVGPTACGKTKLGVLLAKRYDGEVVSADSMQIYKGMTIGTAAPTAEEMEGVPHHMIAVADPAEQWSAARYARAAVPIVDDILRRGKRPILVGGTGLWLDAVVQGRTFAGGHAGGAVRRELQAQLAREGIGPLLEELRQVDPEAADRVFQAGFDLTMVGLDVTQKVRLTTDHVAILDKYAAPENRPIVDYLKQALPFYFRFNRLQNNCLDHCPVHDPLAMLAAVDPSVVTVRTIPARVECGGSFCRGMVVADLREHPIEAPGVSICVDVDSRRALEELLTTFMA